MKNLILGLITAFSISSFATEGHQTKLVFLNRGGFVARAFFQVYHKSNLEAPVAAFENQSVRPGDSVVFNAQLPHSVDQYFVAYQVQAYIGNNCSGQSEISKTVNQFGEFGNLILSAQGTTLNVNCTILKD